jgi:hypothetical protein
MDVKKMRSTSSCFAFLAFCAVIFAAPDFAAAAKLPTRKAVEEGIVAAVSGKEDKSNKVPSVSGGGTGIIGTATDLQYPSARAVYDAVAVKADTAALAAVATSGDFNDLSNIPPPQNISVKEDKSNKIKSVSNGGPGVTPAGTDDQYPSVKAVYDAIPKLDRSDCSPQVSVMGSYAITMINCAKRGPFVHLSVILRPTSNSSGSGYHNALLIDQTIRDMNGEVICMAEKHSSSSTMLPWDGWARISPSTGALRVIHADSVSTSGEILISCSWMI